MAEVELLSELIVLGDDHGSLNPHILPDTMLGVVEEVSKMLGSVSERKYDVIQLQLFNFPLVLEKYHAFSFTLLWIYVSTKCKIMIIGIFNTSVDHVL